MYTYNRCIRVTDNRRQTRLAIDVSMSQTTGDKLDLQWMYSIVTDNRRQTRLTMDVQA